MASWRWARNALVVGRSGCTSRERGGLGSAVGCLWEACAYAWAGLAVAQCKVLAWQREWSCGLCLPQQAL